MTAGQHGKQHGDGMEADAVADQFRGEQKIADQLANAEHDKHRDEAEQAMELQERGDTGDENAGDQAQIRDEAHQAGQHPDQQRKLQADHRQAG